MLIGHPLDGRDDSSDDGGQRVSPKGGSGGAGGTSPAIGGAGGGRGGGGGGRGAPGGAIMGGTERSIYISSCLRQRQNRVCPSAPLHCYITSHHITLLKNPLGLGERYDFAKAQRCFAHTSLWYELSVTMVTSLQGELWL